MGDTMKKHDPLSCTMSLGDHLEELRARLILAIAGLGIGAIVALIFGTTIIRFIEKPYIDAMRPRIEKAEKEGLQTDFVLLADLFFKNMLAASRSDPNAPAIDPNQVAFARKVATDTIRQWQTGDPNAPQEMKTLPTWARLQVLAPAEAFSAYMKVSFIAGLILTCPWVFYQLWMFVAAGLYSHERNYVRNAVPFSAVLFVAGALFFLFVVAPISLRFFLGFGDLMDVASNWTLQRYISFVTVLMLVFGLAFQTPIAIFILNRTGLVSLEALRSVRKYVFLSVFVISAVVTPPDVISQVTLAVPLYALYEVGMLLAHLSRKKAEKKKQEGDSGATPPHRD
jgi:sec-independent protein translocase protein TatC